MGLLSLNSNGTSFLLDEDDVVRVTSVSGAIKLEYINKECNTLATIVVDESLATIDAASDSLIELNFSGVPFLLNYTKIVSVTDYNGGAKVIYACVGMEEIAVDETPTEIDNLVRTPSTQPLQYKALLSQNAPVATTQTPTIIAGQIWEDTIGTANAGDLVILGGYELISGTLGAINAKYRSATDDTPNFTTASLEYDGSPYIVSTDANGDLNPFVNTLGGDIVFSYDGVGTFSGTLVGAFPFGKSNFKPVGIYDYSISIGFYRNDDNSFILEQSLNTSGAPVDIMTNQSVEIEVYP